MKKKAGITAIILAVFFLIMGFVSAAPGKYIKSYGDGSMYEYVGGDAYNYIIEASLRGGEISGAKTARAIYFGAAGILLVLSVLFLSPDEGKEKIYREVYALHHSLNEMKTKTEKLEKMLSEKQRKKDDTPPENA